MFRSLTADEPAHRTRDLTDMRPAHEMGLDRAGRAAARLSEIVDLHGVEAARAKLRSNDVFAISNLPAQEMPQRTGWQRLMAALSVPFNMDAVRFSAGLKSVSMGLDPKMRDANMVKVGLDQLRGDPVLAHVFATPLLDAVRGAA